MLFNQTQKGGENLLIMGVFRKRIYDPNGPYATKSGEKYRLDEYWWIDYRANGKRARERVSTSKRVAMDRLGKIKAEIREGKFFDKKKELPAVKVSEFAEIYLENHCKANNRSWKRSKLCFKHLTAEFGSIFLHELTLWHAEKYRMKRLKTVKLATIYQEISFLKHMYRKAVEWGKLEHNPLVGLKNPKPHNERLRYLTAEEIDRLLAVCKSDDPRRVHLYPIVLMALHTGMRSGEIFNLTWERVDLENGLITITGTKTGENRVIPMTRTLSEVLSSLPKHHKPPYVFVNHNGTHFKKVRRAFDRAVRIAGITNFRFHDLRHTAASHMVMSGVDVFTVQEILGHKSIQMTRRYSHLSPKHKRAAVDALENALGKSGHQNGHLTVETADVI